MSGDKRTPITDALAYIGTIHDQKHGRDAVHIAVLQVTAGERALTPGCPIAIDENRIAFNADDNNPALGIADPFCKDVIMPGQMFYLWIYPNQIKSLRHVWEHPAIANDTLDYPDQDVKQQLELEAILENAKRAIAALEQLKTPTAEVEVQPVLQSVLTTQQQLLFDRICDELDLEEDELHDVLDELHDSMLRGSDYEYFTHPRDSGRWEGTYVDEWDELLEIHYLMHPGRYSEEDKQKAMAQLNDDNTYVGLNCSC